MSAHRERYRQGTTPHLSTFEPFLLRRRGAVALAWAWQWFTASSKAMGAPLPSPVNPDEEQPFVSTFLRRIEKSKLLRLSARYAHPHMDKAGMSSTSTTKKRWCY
jgi:hypothetical protein